MRPLTTCALVLATAVAAGCEKEKAAPTPPPPAATPQVPAAEVPTKPVETPQDPAVASVGLKLNEAQEAISAGKVEEAAALMREVEAVWGKVPADQKADFQPRYIAVKAGIKMLSAATRKS